MKKLVVTLVVMLIASYAMASAYVDWRCSSGFFTHDATDAQVFTSGDDYPYGNIGVGQSVLWALMYTSEADQGSASVTTEGTTSTVHLDDTVVATRYFASGWTDMNDTQFANGVGYDPGLFRIAGNQTSEDFYREDAYTSGRIYQAVFANVAFNAGVITFTDASIYYVFTDDEALVDKVFGPGTPPTHQLLESGSEYAGVRVDSVLNAVPEPATMSLLGLGALVMAIRRRRS